MGGGGAQAYRDSLTQLHLKLALKALKREMFEYQKEGVSWPEPSPRGLGEPASLMEAAWNEVRPACWADPAPHRGCMTSMRGMEMEMRREVGGMESVRGMETEGLLREREARKTARAFHMRKGGMALGGGVFRNFACLRNLRYRKVSLLFLVRLQWVGPTAAAESSCPFTASGRYVGR